nr:MAG TPA: hypothetical protein [Caudoviricetes sp.]
MILHGILRVVSLQGCLIFKQRSESRLFARRIETSMGMVVG